MGMKVKLLEVAGLFSAMAAMRLPYGKEMYSDANGKVSTFPIEDEVLFEYEMKMRLDYRDLKLSKALVERGDGHAKMLRGVIAWAQIDAPLYWWCDLETHVAGRTRLMSASTMNTECRGLRGKELQKVKGEIPFGREIRKVDCFSYQCLRNIVKQRYNHRLPEFHEFIEWIKTLPMANEWILWGLDEELRVHEEMMRAYEGE